jgi:putative transposase
MKQFCRLFKFTLLASGFHQISVKDDKTMQQILRLLQLNLFEKRDLMGLLRGDPPNLNHASDIQMSLL